MIMLDLGASMVPEEEPLAKNLQADMSRLDSTGKRDPPIMVQQWYLTILIVLAVGRNMSNQGVTMAPEGINLNEIWQG